MHPAWYIDDIRLPIVELLEPGDLARLARTNTVMFDCATDHLWETLYSFTPFVYCLPTQVVSRKLQLGETARLDLYARKVKVIVLESSDATEPLDLPPVFRQAGGDGPGVAWRELWTDIAQLRPTSLFLPNLERLRVNKVVDELLLPLVGITGSCMTSIYVRRIKEVQSAHVVREFLDQLQDTSRLEYLFVQDGEPDVVPSKLIEQSPLKRLRLDPRLTFVGDHGDYHCKEFPLRVEVVQKSTLESLNLGLTREWHNFDVQYADSSYLPALRSLRLDLRAFEPVTCVQCNQQYRKYANEWTCTSGSCSPDPSDDEISICRRESPIVFFQGLDRPKLDVLKISFPFSSEGKAVLPVVEAASKNCCLSNLSELSLAGGRLGIECGDCVIYGGGDDDFKMTAKDLRTAVISLLPLKKLRTLRLTVGNNILQPLDIQFYKSMADGLPMLQTLALGFGSFKASESSFNAHSEERVPVKHIAAFCHMVPTLVHVELGCVDGEGSEEVASCLDWVCPNVKSFLVREWIHKREQVNGGWRWDIPDTYKQRLLVCLQFYFPAVDQWDLEDNLDHPTFKRIF